MSKQTDWPDIPYPEWSETCSGLHLWAQIVGKYRLAHTPWVNHSWHATLYVTPGGLTTGPVPDAGESISLSFDFQDHCLRGESSRGDKQSFPLESMSVAEFFGRCKDLVSAIGGTPTIHGSPNELPDPVPFAQDLSERPYDREAVVRFHQALIAIDEVFNRFRTGFLGKVSPAHLFWGSFDFAITRFSGRPAPLHPGGFPALPDSVTREAYSHEVSSAGFWPGGGGVDEAMFYSYAYPVPSGFAEYGVRPKAARFDQGLGEFLLPYAAVRTADDPKAELLAFLQSIYDAAADLAHWDRDSLDSELGVPLVPRAVT